MRKHRFSLVAIIVILLVVALPVTLAFAAPQTGTGVLKRVWLPALAGAMSALAVGFAVLRHGGR